MDSNSTELKMQASSNQQTQSLIVFACIIIAFVPLSIASNSFTLVVLRTSTIFHEIDLILYRLLAVEDMISSIIALISFVIYATTDFIAVGRHFLWHFAMPFLYQTIGVVLTISICRYLMIVRPLHYPVWVTRKRIIVSQAILIVMSFVLSYFLKLLDEWLGRTFKTAWTHSPVTYIIPLVIGFLVQVFTGSHILYISVTQLRHLQRGERAMFDRELRRNGPRDPSGHPHNPQIIREPKRRLPSSFKGLKTVLLIIGSYWVAWFPSFLITLKDGGVLDLPVWFQYLASFTTLVNTCWNPLIYYLTNRTFREAANRTIRMLKTKIFKICNPQTVPVIE